MIPYSNSEPYPMDIQENAIKIVGEEDGVFNNEDYILFYAKDQKDIKLKAIPILIVIQIRPIILSM